MRVYVFFSMAGMQLGLTPRDCVASHMAQSRARFRSTYVS